MKKKAWPFIGDTEKAMGAPSEDPIKGMQIGPQGLRQTFVPGVPSFEENIVPISYGDPLFFPLSNDVEEHDEDDLGEVKAFTREFLSKFGSNSTILGIGPQSNFYANKIIDRDINLYNLSATASTKDANFYEEVGNPMFFNFNKKFDGFYINNCLDKSLDKKITLKNIYSQLRPLSYGLIVHSGEDISDVIKASGFSILEKYAKNLKCYLISKDELSKIALARVYKNYGDSASAIIKCDIAETHQEKVDGLQVYSGLDSETGLLFPYKEPQDVCFHMAKVSFPIDIIFIDNDNKVKKIAKNIQPGSLDLFTCSGVLNVLEISGGMSDALSITDGDTIFIEKASSFDHSDIINNDLNYYKKSSLSNSSLIKIGSQNLFYYSSLDNKVNSEIDYRSIAAFDLDSYIFADDQDNKLFRLNKTSSDTSINIFSEIQNVDKSSYINIKTSDLLTKSVLSKVSADYSVPLNVGSLRINSENNKFLKKLSSIDSRLYRIVFATKKDLDINLLRKIIAREIKTKIGSNFLDKFEILQVPNNFGTEDILHALEQKYRNVNATLFSNNIVKKSGIPVSDPVKAKAKESLEKLIEAIDISEELVVNFEKNYNVYQKMIGKLDVIKNSKGQYNESCNRNSSKAEKMLANIRAAILLLSEIKDVSTTDEIISGIALSSKNASEGIIKIFDLLEQIDEDNFVDLLGQKTRESKNLLNDLNNNLNRAKDYINNDILGIVVLVE
jgi:uncharacterized membrane protein (UPF0127 family)